MASYYDIWQPNFWLDTFWPEEYWYSDDDEYAGTLTPTLADVTSALVGQVAEPGATDGFIAATLGGVSASVVAGSATTIVFDLPVNLSVNWRIHEQGLFSGTIAPTLADLSGSLTGIAWEQSYTSGLIQAEPQFWHPLLWADAWASDFWPVLPQLEGITAALTGSLLAPGAYSGVISVTLGDDAPALSGSIYPPSNYRGEIRVTLGGDASALLGTIIDPIQTGAVAATLDGVTAFIQALSIPAGAFAGHVNPTLDGVTALGYGTFAIPTRTGRLPAALDGLSGLFFGLSLPEESNYGPIRVRLTGVGSVMAGEVIAPRMREKAAQPTVTEIDWKTLCDQHNIGLPEEPDYEFSNGRKFYQS